MRKLASNNSAMLVVCGNEYWTVRFKVRKGEDPWKVCCYNSWSEEYRAKDALRSFTEAYGDPTWIHPFFNNY